MTTSTNRTQASRRGFLRAAMGASVVGGASSAVAAQEGGGSSSGGGTKTIKVGAEGNGGNYAFAPAEATVQPGTKVVWEWTGKGGAHNVVASDGSFDSGAPEAGGGITFSHTFEEKGSFEYHCDPHKTMGMEGTITVGSSSSGSGSSKPAIPKTAKSLGVATASALSTVLGITYIFMKYGGDYGEL